MPVEAVVHQITQRPAAHFGWLDRGVVAPGYLADLNVIDLDDLGCAPPMIATDLPAGGRRLLQAATGYRWTIKRGRGHLRRRRPHRRTSRRAGAGEPSRSGGRREVDHRPTSWPPFSIKPVTDPDRPAVKDLERSLSYAEMCGLEAAELAVGLAERGVVARGTGSASTFPTRSTSWWLPWPACGSAPSSFPLAVTDPPARLESIVADCAPALVVTADRPGTMARHRPATRSYQVAMAQLRRSGADPTGPSTRVGPAGRPTPSTPRGPPAPRRGC